MKMRKLRNSYFLRPDMGEQKQCTDVPNFCLTGALSDFYAVRNAYYKYDNCSKA